MLFSILSGVIPAFAQGEIITVYDKNGTQVYCENSNCINSVSLYISSDEQYSIVLSSGNFTAGYIPLGSNTSIVAQKDTFITAEQNHIFYNTGLAKGYSSLKNVTISGGEWTAGSTGAAYTMMRFLHADGIKIENAVMYGNYSCHLLEFIACQNVKVKNCTLMDKGKTVKNSVEECIQLDVASYTTAPFAYSDKNSPYYDSTPCRNVTVSGCKIVGSRGLCANYAKNEPDKCKKYHYNINIIDCNIEGKTSEAVALFNSAKITVKNCTLVTRRKDNTAYSCGLNIQMLNKKAGNLNPADYAVNLISNTIKGGRQAVCMYSHVGGKWGKTTLKSNKLYCRSGKANAYKIDCKTVKSINSKGNKCYIWK